MNALPLAPPVAPASVSLPPTVQVDLTWLVAHLAPRTE
jgi:hypothetical protein